MSFWVFAVLLIAIALCYVLPPLLEREKAKDDDQKQANISIYRDQFHELDTDLRDGVLDQEQYEQGKLELQRRLLEDVAPGTESVSAKDNPQRTRKTAAVIVGAAVPILAFVLYYQLGTPSALSTTPQPISTSREEEVPDSGPRMPGQPTQQEIESRVNKLAARLKDNPNDGPGWVMLARSYLNFKRYKEASSAFERAAALSPNDPQLLVDYAEALALANNSQLQGRPAELINRALQIDPENNKALWLAGTAAFDAGDFQKALTYWEQLQKLLPEGSEAARAIASSIEDARERLSGTP